MTRILCKYPEYASRYNLKRLKGFCWEKLFRINSPVAALCAVEELQVDDAEVLISSCPELADRYDLKKFSGPALVHLFTEHPSLLKEYPELIDKCKPRGYELLEFLIANPNYAYKYDLNRLGKENLVELLRDIPEAVAQVSSEKLEKFTEFEIGTLIFDHPKLAMYLKVSKLRSS